MRTGAVALIDALGFRGIWRRYDPDAVLTELKAAKNQIETEVQRNAQTYMDHQVAFLSDTIAVSTLVRQTENHRLAWAVLYLGDVIAKVLDMRLRSNMPLAYRGAIAVGNYGGVSPLSDRGGHRRSRQRARSCAGRVHLDHARRP